MDKLLTKMVFRTQFSTPFRHGMFCEQSSLFWGSRTATFPSFQPLFSPLSSPFGTFLWIVLTAQCSGCCASINCSSVIHLFEANVHPIPIISFQRYVVSWSFVHVHRRASYFLNEARRCTCASVGFWRSHSCLRIRNPRSEAKRTDACFLRKQTLNTWDTIAVSYHCFSKENVNHSNICQCLVFNSPFKMSMKLGPLLFDKQYEDHHPTVQRSVLLN